MVRVELDHHRGGALGGEGHRLLDALDVSHLDFERHDQQALGVLGCDAFVHDRHDEEGYVDIRLARDGDDGTGR